MEKQIESALAEVEKICKAIGWTEANTLATAAFKNAEKIELEKQLKNYKRELEIAILKEKQRYYQAATKLLLEGK